MSLEKLKNDQAAIETWFEIVKTDDVSKIENYANNLLAEGEKLEDLIKLKSNSDDNAYVIASEAGALKSVEWLIEHSKINDEDVRKILAEVLAGKEVRMVTILLKNTINCSLQKFLYKELIKIDINQLDDLKIGYRQTFFDCTNEIEELLETFEILLKTFKQDIKLDKSEVEKNITESKDELFNKAYDKIVQKLKNDLNNNPSINPTPSTTTVKTPKEIVDDFYSNRYDIAKFQKKDDSNLSNFLITVPSITLPVAAGVGLYKLLPKYFGAFQHKAKLLAATIGGAVLTFVASFLMAGSLAVKYENNKYANRVTNEIKETRKDLTSDQLDLIKSEIKKRAGEESGHYYNAK